MRTRASGRSPLHRGLALALIVAVGACRPTAAAPSPTPSATATASTSQAATPSLTPATSSPAQSGRHVNAALGYAVTLPPSWRVSGCLSRTELKDPVHFGQDVLTWRTAADEQDLGVSGGTGATGAFAWVVVISAESSSQTVTEFATARAGGSGGQVQATTIDGRPGARVFGSGGDSLGYYVANGGRMYSIALTPGAESRPAQPANATFEAIARSVTFVTPAPRPTPTPAPVVNAAVESAADAVAAAFAASDADRLHDLMTPRCWFNSGYYQSEGTSTSRDKMAANLRTSFSQGLTVSVEPRPIRTDPPMPGSFWVWSTWSAHGTPPRSAPQSNVQLVFDQIDGRWYWVGALFNAAR
jgi:hypothetical protein